MDQQQQGPRALSGVPVPLGPTAPASPPARQIDPLAGQQLALTGGDPADLTRLVSSLRTGLPVTRLRDVAPTLQLPTQAEAAVLLGAHDNEASAALLGPPEDEAPADLTVEHRQDLPREGLLVEAVTPGDAGAPAVADRVVALIVQDMAAFGGAAGREMPRLNGPVEGHRFDYFA